MGVFSNTLLEQVTDREQQIPDVAEVEDHIQSETDTAPAPAEPVKPALNAATVTEQTEDEKRQAHEAAEAKRKAEWEAKKKAREEAEKAEWDRTLALSDDALIDASVKRLGDATERLTRRNMKLCVTEYVQTKCYEDMNFAKQVMHPRKSMLNCFHYINRKAREYLEQEMKDNDEKPMQGMIGGDVPDDLCYQWAEEYFTHMDLPEDKNDTDEEFVPKPYRGSVGASRKKTAKKKKSELKKDIKPKPQIPDEQVSLFGAGTGVKTQTGSGEVNAA